MRRFAFVVYGYPLGVSPMITNSIELLARRGLAVDVYMDEGTFRLSPIEFSEPGVRVVLYRGGASFIIRLWAAVMARLADRLRLFEWMARVLPPALTIFLVFPSHFLFSRWLRRQLETPESVLAVEAGSLIASHALPAATRLVYYDMELLDWARDNPLYRCKLVLKHLQFRMLERVGLIAVQSPQRARLFAEINRFDPARTGILPVAAMGDGVARRGRFFRDLFGISEATTIVVYSGNFMPWAQCVEIIESVRAWPAGTALVMHTWNTTALEGDYFRRMQQAANGLPVHFSSEYVDPAELAPALSSADIGVLLYEAIDGNFTEILFSSNKLAEYLKAGLPVICSDFPSLREYVEGKGIGFAVASPAAIGETVARIRGQLEAMRANVRRVYEEDFRFERYFDGFFERLTAYGQQRRTAANSSKNDSTAAT